MIFPSDDHNADFLVNLYWDNKYSDSVSEYFLFFIFFFNNPEGSFLKPDGILTICACRQ